MIQLGSAYGTVEIGTGEAERNVNSLASSMRRVGGAMSLAISAPLMAVGAAGLKAAAGFEQSMNQVEVIAGATAAQMGQLQDVALRLGADTSFSAGEAAQGMLELAKAGLSVEDTMSAISGVLDLAAAGGLSVAQAAEISANALNAFNLPASDATRVANLLAAAANASSVEVTDMAQAFAMSSSVFASNGQSIDDLSTAIALLGNNGLKGSDAGTSLKTMLMRLTAPTGEAADAMEALGIQVYNADGSMRSFQDVVGQLESSTAGLTAEQRNMALTTIFGADAIRAANILIKEGADEFDSMKDAVNEAGAAQTVAEARMKGLAGAIEYAKGTIESTLVAAFLPLLDTIGGIIRGAADLIGKFGELPEPVRNAALAIGLLLAAVGPILVAIPMIGAVIAAVATPVGAVVLAVAGLAAAVAGLAAAWAMNWGGIRDKTAAAMKVIQPGLDAVRAWLEEKITAGLAVLRAKWNEVWAALQTAFDAAWAGIETGLTTAKTAIETNLPTALATLQTAWTTGWAALQTAFDAAWAGIETGLTTAKTAIETNLPTALATLQTAWTAGWAALQTAFDSAWASIKTGLTTAKTAIETNLPTALATLQTAWTTGWAALQTAFDSAWAGIQTGITKIQNWFSTDIPGALTSLQSTWTTVMSAVQATWKLLVDFLQPTINKIIAAFPLMIASFAPVGGKLKELWDVAGPVILKLNAVFGVMLVAAVKLFGETVAAIMPHVGTVVGLILDALILAFKAADTALTTLMDAFQKNWPAIQLAVENAWTAISTAFANAKTWLTVTLPADLLALRDDWALKWDEIKAKVDAVVAGIVGTFESIQTWLTSTLQTAVNTFNTFLGTITLPNPFAAIQSTIDGIKAAIDKAQAAIQSFKDWIGSISFSNPFAGLSLPNLSLPGRAMGTMFAPAGMTLVGERGPELVELPQGARVHTADQTRRMGDGGQGGDIVINLGGVTVASEIDVHELAWRLAGQVRARTR